MPITPIDYNPFATQYAPPVQARTPGMGKPVMAPPGPRQPYQQPEMQPGLQQPLNSQDVQGMRQNLATRQHAQSFVDRGQDAELSGYIRDQLSALPQGDKRRAIYNYMNSLHRYTMDQGRATKRMRQGISGDEGQVSIQPVGQQFSQQQPQQPRPQAQPRRIQPGQVVRGFQYMGGDPNDRNSWQQMR